MSSVPVMHRMPDLSAGLCRGRLEEFEDINTLTSYRAAQVCLSGCPVFELCRDWGVRHERHGMWGGLTDRQLAAARREHGIAIEEIRTGELAPRPKPVRRPAP